ncbi:SRPBCC domain-containing protein [Amycolatopsis sp. 195334CR]|uniref:SRPBCC domain-containing protein n=1 Tax=Amycolatopsis sp. 195334CR TaxID=2814588 RepID=UPI001A8E7BE2|nr:SRPBCC domain-containing protein [Amycolatopsis sp. 195334CR]MBN6034994.1 SRPBCC domain-containing protein [Amycolatopsis sp. 195334CR]
MKSELNTVEGKPVLRFERTLRHSPAKVWRAISEPAEMAHWFPALITAEPKPGAKMEFAFEGEEETTYGEVLEYDPPKVHAFRWNSDVLRFELLPAEAGCVLVFTHTVDAGARFTAARTAAGWDVCLAAMVARLDGRTEEPLDHRPLMQSYLREFELARGEETEDGVRFVLDVVWRPFDTVWAALSGGKTVEIGQEPPLPFTIGPVPAGQVVAVDAPRDLTYRWRHDGENAGLVRWRLVHDPELATYVELTQTIPAKLSGVRATVLAAWQERLEQLFADLLRGTS